MASAYCMNHWYLRYMSWPTAYLFSYYGLLCRFGQQWVYSFCWILQ